MTARQIQYKTRNQIFSDFVNISNTALAYFNLKGWQTRQLRQIFKVNILTPTIFISIINNPQRGVQYRERTKQGNIIKRANFTKQEVQIRFSAARRELATDNVNTYSATDALKVVKEYIQSEEGILKLAEMNYAQYRATTVQEQNFINDDDNFEFLPYFDCTFLYTDSWSLDINRIDKVKEKGIYKV